MLLVPENGGGVATFALLTAKATGAVVTVTSRDPEKRKKALELGADATIDNVTDWSESMKREKSI